MVVLLTCKNKEDPIKNEGARVFTTLYTERIKFSNFLKCLYCCCYEKYYVAADHIQLV